MANRLVLEPIPGRFAVCRLPAGAAVPEWALAPPRTGHGALPSLMSITRTADELSIVAPQELIESVPDDPAMKGNSELRLERDFIAWRVAGTLDFAQVGILAKLTNALADAGVAVFVISTFDTDVLLVRAHDATVAADALRSVARL